MPIILRLLSYLRPYRTKITLGLLCLVADISLELSPGFVWLYIVDHVIQEKNLSGLLPAICVLIGIALSESVISRWRRLLLEATGQGFVFDLRNILFEKLSSLPLAFFNESRTGDLMSRVSADVESVQEVVVNGTDTLLANLLRLIGVVFIFCKLNLALGLAVVSPIFLVGLLLSIFNKRVKLLYRASREQLGALNARLNDSLSGIRVVKGFARERAENAAFRGANQKFLSTNLHAIRARANIFPWISFVVSFTNTTTLAFGAYLILQGKFTLGGLVAYRTYGRFFYGPIDNLTQINDMMQRAIAAGRRIFEVIDTPETVIDLPNATELPSLRGRIEFDHVGFSYQPAAGGASSGPVLDDLTFSLEPGQKVALVGRSGAGKSTVFSLLARFWDPTTGTIRLDGHDLRSVTQSSLRRQVVSVQQDTFLFATTVGENIRYGCPEATDAEVEAAARASNAHEFIERLPNGYATVVGERGVKLSGGQRQRIAVARAFLAGGSLVLLDEATSAVEPESERLIYEGLDRLLEGRTAVIATHRLSTIEGADLILVLDNGRIVERGTHVQLLREQGRYAEMIGRGDVRDTENI